MNGLDIIIPAFNEAKTIAGVIRASRACPLVERVFVIDDGSWDGTSSVAEEAGASVIRLRENKGKTAALLRGAENSRASIVVLLDGDLIGLRTEHIESLAKPVIDGKAEMTVGVFRGGRWLTDLSQRLTPFLNGQRALKRELLLTLKGHASSRYAADALLTRYARRRALTICMVELAGLTHVMKEEKLGWKKGVIARAGMFWQIFFSLVFSRLTKT